MISLAAYILTQPLVDLFPIVSELGPRDIYFAEDDDEEEEEGKCRKCMVRHKRLMRFLLYLFGILFFVICGFLVLQMGLQFDDEDKKCKRNRCFCDPALTTNDRTAAWVISIFWTIFQDFFIIQPIAIFIGICDNRLKAERERLKSEGPVEYQTLFGLFKIILIDIFFVLGMTITVLASTAFTIVITVPSLITLITKLEVHGDSSAAIQEDGMQDYMYMIFSALTLIVGLLLVKFLKKDFALKCKKTNENDDIGTSTANDNKNQDNGKIPSTKKIIPAKVTPLVPNNVVCV